MYPMNPASGGIARPSDVAVVLEAGAIAVQTGTAFLRSEVEQIQRPKFQFAHIIRAKWNRRVRRKSASDREAKSPE